MSVAAASVRPGGGPAHKALARKVLGRIASGVVVLWAAITLAFLSVQIAPGDIVDIIVGDQIPTPAVAAAIRAEWGLDQPVIVQYFSYLGRVVQGDFGRSYMLQADVGPLLLSQVWPTLKLTMAGVLVAVVFALSMALLTARRPVAGRVASGIELFLVSTPSFWLGIVLLYVFSFTLKIFPVAGDRSLSALVLPALALGLSLGAVLGQVLRQSLERALEEPFALTVKSWGVTEATLRLRHALRHAAIPSVTLAGWLIGGLLSGTVITEQVFGRPGLGRITVDAVLSKDIPVILATAILSAAIYVTMSTIVDLLYLLLDPRLRRGGK
ncbi:ABC transporter permease [Paracoccus aminophilus]|uniref:ABC-type dipeptide/oligopeptide/nickel transport systems, permease component n=1 Tax=Paracoccus aminophilus JCM 7686 TaxID=1367847 RepID=S5Y542_PARAH|nr:ABC transporter permease [Paracoccus aminophilus]AGT10855.1 ABC-type dipeptide/oligopeptide/nickel transport systems, permease component [Paracoccus aminophilus JCM 7686]